MTIQSKTQIQITDVNPQINRGLVWIEINLEWFRFPATDFFDFLAQEGHITGHDPKNEIAWNSAPEQVRWNPATQEPEEYTSPWTHESRPYNYWLTEFIDDDALIAKYVESYSFYNQ